MKAIVFAAGVGSRMKPWTDSHPKALAPIGGVPMLQLVLEKLKAAGADGVVVNVHHFPEQIREFLAENRNFGLDIEISDESDRLLETGGALAKIFRESRIIREASDTDAIVVHNADILTDFPVQELVAKLNDNEAALLIDPQRDSTRRFLFNADWRLAGWTNLTNGAVRPEGLNPAGLQRGAFGGVHAMNKRTLADVSRYCGAELRPFSIVDFYLDICPTKPVSAFVPAQPYMWFDIGTTEKLAAAEKAFAEKSVE